MSEVRYPTAMFCAAVIAVSQTVIYYHGLSTRLSDVTLSRGPKSIACGAGSYKQTLYFFPISEYCILTDLTGRIGM